MNPVAALPVTHAAVAAELTRPMAWAREASSDHSAAMAFEAVIVCFTRPTTTRLNTSNSTDLEAWAAGRGMDRTRTRAAGAQERDAILQLVRKLV